MRWFNLSPQNYHLRAIASVLWFDYLAYLYFTSIIEHRHYINSLAYDECHEDTPSSCICNDFNYIFVKLLILQKHDSYLHDVTLKVTNIRLCLSRMGGSRKFSAGWVLTTFFFYFIFCFFQSATFFYRGPYEPPSRCNWTPFASRGGPY